MNLLRPNSVSTLCSSSASAIAGKDTRSHASCVRTWPARSSSCRRCMMIIIAPFALSFLATRRRHAAMSRVQESIQKNERQLILDRQSLAHMENSSWRHMDDLHCALEDQEPSHFK